MSGISGCMVEGVFTLTLTLSLRERGQIERGLALPPLPAQEHAPTLPPLPAQEHEPALPPLPQGEGRGEGDALLLHFCYIRYTSPT